LSRSSSFTKFSISDGERSRYVSSAGCPAAAGDAVADADAVVDADDADADGAGAAAGFGAGAGGGARAALALASSSEALCILAEVSESLGETKSRRLSLRLVSCTFPNRARRASERAPDGREYS
jgi:hypothetical protein